MEEFLELRVAAEFADRVFDPDEGELLQPIGFIRKIRIRSDDARLPRIIAIQKELNEQDPPRLLVGGWEFVRRYTAEELARAQLFHMTVSAVFEPAGAECGTVYDTANVCPICGAGRSTDQLRLRLGRVPKRADIACTIASDEWIVNDRVATLIRQEGITGVDLQPVVDVGAVRGGADRRSWFQLRPVGTRLRFSPRSRFGSSPIDPENKRACPAGDTAGHALISRAYVVRPEDTPTDISASSQHIGTAIGLIVPRRALFISPHLRALFVKHKIRGINLAIADFDAEGFLAS